MRVNQTNGGLSIADMAASYAENAGMEEEDLFSTPAAEPAPVPEEPAAPVVPKKAEKTGWTPSAEALAELPELQQKPVTYSADEYQEDVENHALENVADGEAKQLARKTMDVLERSKLNIDDALARNGIKHLMIPQDAGPQPGAYHAMLTMASEDDDYARGQATFDQVLHQIIAEHPEYVEWEHPEEHGVPAADFRTQGGEIMDIPDDAVPPESSTTPDAPQPVEKESDDVKVVIDKRNASEIAWTEEEVEKIRRSRNIELEIVEGGKIEFGDVEVIEGSAVDQVMEEYVSKVGSITAPLPASKYRATFIGLQYLEILDLSSSNAFNNLDGEWKMWSICFEHIRNPSIGPWEEWDWYIDPKTNKRVEIHAPNTIPDDIPKEIVHHMTKFHDFLHKTSYKDLQYMLWKILCATAMEQEIISVQCKTELPPDNHQCGHFYDWVYAPSELLDAKSMNPVVLEEMEKTMNAVGKQIMENYMTSPVVGNNTVGLNSSGFKIAFGHTDAYTWLTEMYEVTQVDMSAIETDPTLAATKMTAEIMPAVKGIYVPRNGKWALIQKAEDMFKTIRALDEFDFQALTEVAEMILSPYDLQFSVRGLICPKCKNTATIAIPNIARLLFIVAQSLSSVQVKLKKT